MTGIAMIILGVIFFVVALYTLFVKIPKSRKQIEKRSGKTTGVVKEIHKKTYQTKKRNGAGYRETHTYKADFTFNVGGQEYMIKGVPVFPAPEEGEQVDISYDPDNPQDAHADKFFADPASNKSGGMVLAIVAAVLLILGIVIQII